MNRAQRTLITVALAPVTMASAFYVAAFIYRLTSQLLFYVATVGMLVLHALGVSAPIIQAPSAILEPIRRSGGALTVAGAVGALIGLVLLARAAGRHGRAWRQSLILVATALMLAVTAAAVDAYYGVTPFADRLSPHESFASIEPRIACRLTPADLTTLPDRQSGCIAEVNGILEYSTRMHRFALRSLDIGGPAVNVFFFRGRRSQFSETPEGNRPRYYDQVAEFIGQPVRVVGVATNGQIDVDVGHIALR